MLGKLIKYDLKAIKKVFLPFIIVVLSLSLVIPFSIRTAVFANYRNTISPNIGWGLLFIFDTIVIILGSIGFFASILIIFIAVYEHYYKNLFSDEGYLTFTLPASRSQILFSKTVASLVWTLIGAFCLSIGVFLVLLLAPTPDSGLIDPFIIVGIGRAISKLWELVGFWLILYIFEGLLLIALTILSSITIIELSITVGAALAKKLKILAALGIYYAINTVIGGVSQFLTFIASITFPIKAAQYLPNMSASRIFSVVALAIFFVCIVFAMISALAYLINERVLQRRLNLA